jgi:hypothetical protein
MQELIGADSAQELLGWEDQYDGCLATKSGDSTNAAKALCCLSDFSMTSISPKMAPSAMARSVSFWAFVIRISPLSR